MHSLGALGVGLAGGILSGIFGIGGGLILTPMLLFFLKTPELLAVETPLIAVLPATLASSVIYTRAKNVDFRIAILSGVSGAITAYAGARIATIVGGGAIILLTAVVLVFSAFQMFKGASRKTTIKEDGGPQLYPHPNTFAIVGSGLIVGVLAGLLGVGGGFVFIPLFTGIFGLSMKRAIGTSLVSVAIISVAGIISHVALGNIDIPLGLLLAAGAVPGAIIGARIGLGAEEKKLKFGFGILMIFMGLLLVARQVGLF